MGVAIVENSKWKELQNIEKKPKKMTHFGHISLPTYGGGIGALL